MTPPITDDYSTITEVPGSGATRAQLARLAHRYMLAATYAPGRRILEVACGAGFGLGSLASSARLVVGGDYTHNLLRVAQAHYEQRVPLVRLDGHRLPCADQSFDLVILFEALYYLAHPEHFIREAHRILDTNGILIIGTVNREWDEFAPSPFSTRYLAIHELHTMLQHNGFRSVECYGAFPTESSHTPTKKIVALIRKIVIALHLMPRTLEGRARFKRMVYGKLTPLPPEMYDGMADVVPTDPIPCTQPCTSHTILYTVGQRGVINVPRTTKFG